MQPEIPYTQYVIVPEKPKMSKGKVASQVAHATYMALWKDGNKCLQDKWRKNGMCVIVLKCRDTAHLNDIAKYLEQWEIKHHLYIDEGLYGCEPFTPTALATAVILPSKYWIFKNLDLY